MKVFPRRELNSYNRKAHGEVCGLAVWGEETPPAQDRPRREREGFWVCGGGGCIWDGPPPMRRPLRSDHDNSPEVPLGAGQGLVGEGEGEA